MGNTNSENPSDHEWDDRGDLIWNEFDWELYLREQDDVVLRYLGFYEQHKVNSERLDYAARQMGWRVGEWTSEGVQDGIELEDDSEDDDEDEIGEDAEPYTLHKNPIYIATRALFMSLRRAWEELADDPAKVPQALAVRHLSVLSRTEDQAMQAVSALDFGDYAMAISLFKRALRDLNLILASLDERACGENKALLRHREQALPRLFDLREVWLRVMSECRTELARPVDDIDEDEGDED